MAKKCVEMRNTCWTVRYNHDNYETRQCLCTEKQLSTHTLHGNKVSRKLALAITEHDTPCMLQSGIPFLDCSNFSLSIKITRIKESMHWMNPQIALEVRKDEQVM